MKTWTLEETDTLKRCYGHVTNEAICGLIPNKTLTAIHKKARKLGLKVSEEIKFQNRSKAQRISKRKTWNGGQRKSTAGYRMLLMPEHPRADNSGYVLEHIVVFEAATGITIPAGCCIHHINGIKDDNRISNLCLMTHGAHTAMHHTGAKRSAETRRKMSERKMKNVK